jgi:heme/copper-type cytochrome/quinol oxidase subunit 2
MSFATDQRTAMPYAIGLARPLTPSTQREHKSMTIERIAYLLIVLVTVPPGVTAQDFQSPDIHIEPLAQSGRFPATLELAQTAGVEAEVQASESDATGAGYPAHGQHQGHASKGKKMGQGAGGGAMAAEGDAKVFEFTIVHGKLGDEEPTIQVTEGDILEFRWSSDEALSLHMHGYKIAVDVVPNSPATMRVNAIKTGRFPVLNHDGSPPNVLLYLEVLPK